MNITPSEIIYWEILPAIRKEIVFCMKDRNLKQVEIASILNITPAAVSQYLSNKRGNYSFSDDFKLEISNSTNKIISKESSAFDETNRLIKLFENSGKICKICNKKNDTSSSCNVCFD